MSFDLSWNLLEDGAGQLVFGLWGLELMIIMCGIENPSRNVLFEIFNIIIIAILLHFNNSAAVYLLTNKLDDVPGGLLVATAEPGLVTVQLLHDAHVALPDPHQDHADRQLAQSDEDPLSVLDVSDPAIRDEEDHSVLHL